MKLYSLDLSNFSSKSRIVIYEKGLTVEMISPPGGLNSADYKKVSPLGKVPALQLDDGRVIPEAEVINEYLEEMYPQPPMLPKDAGGRARARLLSRFSDLYLDPPLRALIPILFGRTLEEKLVQDRVAEIENRLDQLEILMGGTWAAGDGFTIADAALAPTIFLLSLVLQQVANKSQWESRRKLASWWERIQEWPSIRKVLDEQRNALSAMLKK